MSVSIVDIPFPISAEMRARWDFHSWGQGGVQAICGGCGYGYGWGPNGLKKLGRTTPRELIEHCCGRGER